jgi:hypothetical protein
MKKLRKKEKDDFQQNIISKKRWITYFKKLWTDPDEADMIELFNENYDFDNIQLQTIEIIIKEGKNKKTPGIDSLNMELYK